MRAQLDALYSDLPPDAIKIGMLGNEETINCVGDWLDDILGDGGGGSSSADDPPLVVLDPVMIATSGDRLITEGAQNCMIRRIFKHAAILTPNRFEAESLVGKKIDTADGAMKAADEILAMGCRSVILKGGHDMVTTTKASEANGVNATNGYAQDYFLSRGEADREAGPRLCDGDRGVWLRSSRYDSSHTHGTGCTLSSAIASLLGIGRVARENEDGRGAEKEIRPVDAAVVAKAYVTKGIGKGVGIGKGPGPVVHTHFPCEPSYFPELLPSREMAETAGVAPFKAMAPADFGVLLPIVDSLAWVKKLTKCRKVTHIQLRIKGVDSAEEVDKIIEEAQGLCKQAEVKLWVNDFWESAAKHRTFGVHLGQEDLARCADRGGLEVLQKSGLALGVSTHSYGELSAALGVRPSYISFGPIFGTKSKKVAFEPQGLELVKKWRGIIGPDTPFVVIGGINSISAGADVFRAGADCVAAIGAITKGGLDDSNDVDKVFLEWEENCSPPSSDR